MAESVFGKPIDNAIQEINDKIGTVPSGETVEGQISNLGSQLFFGANNGKHYEGSNSSLDNLIDNAVVPTSDNDGYFTITNNAAITNYGNRQLIIGWLNAGKTYGWCLIMSFDAIGFGKRGGSSSFAVTKIA